nr:hypothetical protein [Lachnospiraceae bacterium]
KVVPEHIKIQDVDYYCASVSTPIRIQIQKTGKDDTKKYGDITFKSYRQEKYFLYYTYSTGATPGQPITDVFVDGNIFISGMYTAICANSEDVVDSSTGEVKKAKLYGNSQLPCFIHAMYEKSKNMVFNKLYAAEGNTREEALAKLLEQECTDYIDIDLNDRTKNNKKAQNLKYVYLGYRGYSIDTDAIKKERTEEAKKEERDRQFSDAIYDIVCTVDEEFHPEGIISEKNQLYYTPVCRENENGQTVGVDLNSGTSGAKIYMYYCTPWMTDKYNSKIVDNGRKISASSPQDVFSAPIKRICFTEYDRVPYLQGASADSYTSASVDAGNKESENALYEIPKDNLSFDKSGNVVEGTQKTEEEPTEEEETSGLESSLLPSLGEDKWEYVLYSNSNTPADLNDGAVIRDINGDAENNKITMFAQRYDGSVKPSAEITGGYVTPETESGEMWICK